MSRLNRGVLNRLRCEDGFSLLEAALVVVFLGVSFVAIAYLYANVTQRALTADLTILATKLAHEKMEEVVQQKADGGYASVVSQAASPVQSGSWNFTRAVNVTYVNPADFSTTASDLGYKRVDVTVAWGSGAIRQVVLTTLLTNMIPSAVVGTGYTPCP